MSEYKILGEWNRRPEAEATAELAGQFEAALEEGGVAMKAMMNLCVVFDELYANICNYSGADIMSLTVYKNDENVKIEFVDNGIPFDPTKAEEVDITKPIEEREIGGLGIHMVKKMTDSMTYEYRDGQNCLTLLKNC